MKRTLGWALLCCALLASCKKDAPVTPAVPDAPAPSAKDDLSADERAAVKEAMAEKDEPTGPVYPVTGAPADPVATAFCSAVQGVPHQRAAKCCGSAAGFSLGLTECQRTLTAAINSKAVTVDGAALKKCSAAMEAATQACDWVGDPPLPSECTTVLNGTLAAGAVCRSTLECSGSLYCAGVGPTQAGHCAPQVSSGSACGVQVDPLVIYTRQDQVETQRPGCDGWCIRGRCSAFKALGTACESSLQCGPNAHCKDGTCSAGGPAAVGEACGARTCQRGLRCVDGACRAPRAVGSACASDGECASRCKDHKCAMFCGVSGADLQKPH